MSNSQIRDTIEEYQEDMRVEVFSASPNRNELLMLEWYDNSTTTKASSNTGSISQAFKTQEKTMGDAIRDVMSCLSFDITDIDDHLEYDEGFLYTSDHAKFLAKLDEELGNENESDDVNHATVNEDTHHASIGEDIHNDSDPEDSEYDVDSSENKKEKDDVDVMTYKENEIHKGGEGDYIGGRRSALNKLKKAFMQGEGDGSKYAFYYAQVFSSSKEVKDRVYLHSIETRRDLKFVRNNKLRKEKEKCGFKVLDANVGEEYKMQSIISMGSVMCLRQVLTTVGIDENNGIYHVVYALVEAETMVLVQLQEVEFRRISLTGFRSCTIRSQYRSVSKQTTQISIFTVNTSVSLGCSGTTTRIIRRTLRIFLVFKVCKRQVYWNGVLMRFIDDLLALNSIVHFDFSDRRLEQTATFSILANSE
ncbi:hypothetical protein Tco_0914719 [Tanacetum coccineum]